MRFPKNGKKKKTGTLSNQNQAVNTVPLSNSQEKKVRPQGYMMLLQKLSLSAELPD